MKTTRIVAATLLPLIFAACSVRQLNDGSWTTCRVGDTCQVGPRGAAYVAPVRPIHNNNTHHVVHQHAVKKPVVVKKTTTTTTTSTSTSTK